MLRIGEGSISVRRESHHSFCVEHIDSRGLAFHRIGRGSVCVCVCVTGQAFSIGMCLRLSVS